eukprot:1144487-Pelagomonas_calceolata.AAC.6
MDRVRRSSSWRPGWRTKQMMGCTQDRHSAGELCVFWARAACGHVPQKACPGSIVLGCDAAVILDELDDGLGWSQKLPACPAKCPVQVGSLDTPAIGTRWECLLRWSERLPACPAKCPMQVGSFDPPTIKSRWDCLLGWSEHVPAPLIPQLSSQGVLLPWDGRANGCATLPFVQPSFFNMLTHESTC